MEESYLSQGQLKRYLKHLCVVTKHYYSRENAKKNLDTHLKKATKSNKEIAELNRKINVLLEKETKIAELGLRKKVPDSVVKKLRFLGRQLQLVTDERDRLMAENEELRKGLQSVGEIKSAIEIAQKTREDTEKRVKQMEDKVDKKYREFALHELQEKIDLLESNYEKVSKDNSISPSRLIKIEQKLEEYKDKLESLKKE